MDGPRLFAYPLLRREGLGNLMFTWARAEVFAHRCNARVIAPQWTHFKPGPFIRRERDKRLYLGLFNRKGMVTGPRRWWLLARATKVTEDVATDEWVRSRSGSEAVVVFEGMKDTFRPLLAHQPLVRGRLLEILSRRSRADFEARRGDVPPIALHIRRGDMLPLPPGQRFHLTCNRRLPDEWFVQVLRSLRHLLGNDVPARVYSDAGAEELGFILSEPNVELATPRNAIVDILLLSQSRILVTSGQSTFSRWAAFLGKPATLWYPGLSSDLRDMAPELCIEATVNGEIDDRHAATLRAMVPSTVSPVVSPRS